jgi:Tfp pilus assembly protein PilP
MKRLTVLLCSIALAACASNDQEELREWMNTAAQGAKPRIPPLPVVEPYEPVPYDVTEICRSFQAGQDGAGRKKGRRRFPA